MSTVIRNVVVKKVVYERPKHEDEDPKATVTLEIDADQLATTKTLLDFAAAGPCDWTVESIATRLSIGK